MIWLIGIGGALGAVTRYIVGHIINNRTKKAYPFPIGTWIINISGSFLLGLLTQFYISNEISEGLFYFGSIGFCGAFTTFSTFGYETITLIHLNKKKLALFYVSSSVVLGVISAMVGYYI